MRWRTEAEVTEGKGQFVCGEKTCSAAAELRTWEVNFKYEEQGTTKNALVKQRLCHKCSEMLNFRHRRKEVKSKKHKHKKKKERKRGKHDNERSGTRKRKHGVNSPHSSPSLSSPPDSDANQSGSKSWGKKKRRSSNSDAGERFLDQFWEDMIT